MNKSCLPVQLLWFAWLCSLSTITSAQSNSAPLHQYDALMQSLFERKQQDSFLLLAQYKADLAKKADSLDVWAQTQLNMHEAFEDDYGRCAKHLNAVWGQRWRDPATAAEARPFMFVFATLGFYLSKLNQHKRANEMYEIAARFYEKYRFTDFNVANALYKPLGANYIRLGENEKAIAVLHKGLMAGGTNSVLSGFYANIGIAYWNQDDFSAAEVYYRQGLALDSVPDIQRCLLLCRLAETLLDEQKPNQAREMAINAVKLLPNVEPDDHRALEYRARAYRVAGMACTQLTRYAEAQKLLNAALNDDKMAARQQVSREVGKDLNELARLMILLGRPDQALPRSNQALTAVL
ncbi:MAG: tetratricopeptide repeat protein, partial [Saprospiraceae bacterium]|nr:tetratricopeptide repeat protein [Saprospiraceae bacterium]